MIPSVKRKRGSGFVPGSYQTVFWPNRDPEEFYTDPVYAETIQEANRRNMRHPIYISDGTDTKTGWHNNKWIGKYAAPTALVQAISEEILGYPIVAIEVREWDDGRMLTLLQDSTGIGSTWCGLHVIEDEIYEG